MSAVEIMADRELSSRRTSPPTNEFRLMTLDEFVQRPSLSFLVRDLLPAKSIVVVFGPPKGGKTFSVCDLTMHAAHGMSWQGHQVTRPIRVAYLAGEGTTGLKVRLRAWIEHHDSIEEPGEFRLLPEALSLPENAVAVVTAAGEFAPDVIVIDTLNAYFGGGDENSTQDMTRFVHAVRHLRDELNCAVIVVHHTGHADQTRERGSIALRGAADVLIQVAKDEGGNGNVGFQVVAARDLEPMNEPISLKLRHVETSWCDDDGQHLATCIVESAQGPVTLAGRSKPLGVAQSVVLEVARLLALQRTPDANGEILIARADIAAIATKERGASRQSVSSAWRPLADRKFFRLVEPGSIYIKVKR